MSSNQWEDFTANLKSTVAKCRGQIMRKLTVLQSGYAIPPLPSLLKGLSTFFFVLKVSKGIPWSAVICGGNWLQELNFPNRIFANNFLNQTILKFVIIIKKLGWKTVSRTFLRL